MNNEWQQFLRDAGARIADGHVDTFGDADGERAAVQGDILADLSHYGLVAARGEDAGTFLQGQLTNDVREVSDTRHQLTSHCTPKGRALAVFRLFRREDAYYFRLPAELTASLLKRLRMYVLRSKVALDDVSMELARFGLAGANADALLVDAIGTVPATADSSATIGSVTVLRVPGVTPRFEIYGNPAHLSALWRRLAARARPVGAQVWSLSEILAGMPTVYAATGEAFVPQMLNLHAIHGVSFRKGCYTGQEVVARMHYLGKLKRRMYRAHVDAIAKPGDELYGAEVESGQGAGKVVDAAPAPGGGYDLLAVILISAVESGSPLRLHDAEGAPLRIEALPYAVDELGGTAA